MPVGPEALSAGVMCAVIDMVFRTVGASTVVALAFIRMTIAVMLS